MSSRSALNLELFRKSSLAFCAAAIKFFGGRTSDLNSSGPISPSPSASRNAYIERQSPSNLIRTHAVWNSTALRPPLLFTSSWRNASSKSLYLLNRIAVNARLFFSSSVISSSSCPRFSNSSFDTALEFLLPTLPPSPRWSKFSSGGRTMASSFSFCRWLVNRWGLWNTSSCALENSSNVISPDPSKSIRRNNLFIMMSYCRRGSSVKLCLSIWCPRLLRIMPHTLSDHSIGEMLPFLMKSIASNAARRLP
mmetsp:Transcript_8046/g.19408  ORF Transcript_8046/g.19408 Transcript_8046/m.19408 type:complete len:251 (-) Transcript_8046:409-1161(-)